MNEAMRINFALMSIWTLYVHGVHAKGYCSFPRFIWDPMPDGSDRKWYWKTEYFHNSDSWETQNELTTMETEIVIEHRVRTDCERDNPQRRNTSPCYRKEKVYTIICVTEEAGKRYRVQLQFEDGQTSFSCFEFRQVSADAMIVYTAENKVLNEDRLCYDESLHRDPWPWIAGAPSEWSPCPLQGGFDFKGTYGNRPSQMLCPLDWRPSRLESECVRGEGITFFFPNKHCNPFGPSRNEQILLCWASWVEGDFTFALMGEYNQHPRYVLRVPRAANDYDEFAGYLYTSPTVTLNTTGFPDRADGVTYYRLDMLRSEPGTCYDESPICRLHAREGKCTNSALHQYGNYCKKSCGLCVYAPSAEAECKFPADLKGDWVKFDADSREEVTIGDDTVAFSTLGKYTCKTKHWEDEFYKTISIFQNGWYANTRSSRSDSSFSICTFRDDPLPVGDKIRSRKAKTLLPISSMFYGSCGIGGLARAEVTVSRQRHCSGRIWDVDRYTCDSRSVLTLALPMCHIEHEYLCSALSRLSTGGSLLVLKQEAPDPHYYCWKLTEIFEGKSRSPSIEMKRVHCDTSEHFVFSLHGHGLVAIHVYKDLRNDICGRYTLQANDDHAAANVDFSPIVSSAPTLRPVKSTHPYSDDKVSDSEADLTKERRLHLIDDTLPSANAHIPMSSNGSSSDKSKNSHSIRHTDDKVDRAHPSTNCQSQAETSFAMCLLIVTFLFLILPVTS